MNLLPSKMAAVVVAFAAASTLTACVSKTTEGVVFDSATNKPIAGAFVILVLQHAGADAYGSRSSCLLQAVVRADDGGRYRVSGEDFLFSSRSHREIYAYVPGYDWDDKVPDQNGTRLAVKPFTGTGNERVRQFDTYANLMGCGRKEDYIPLLRPLYEAMDKELKTLVVTDPRYRDRMGRGFVQSLDSLAASIDKSK